MTRIYLVLIAILSFSTFIMWDLYTLEKHQSQLYQDELYAIRNDTISRIQLSEDKIAYENPVIVQSKLNNSPTLKVKPRRIVSTSEIGFGFNDTLEIELDSLLPDTDYATTYCPDRTFHYTDPYLNLTGTITENSEKINFTYRDTLIQVVYYGKRVHKYWPFSRRRLMQRISLGNPKAYVSYAKTIKVQNGRR